MPAIPKVDTEEPRVAPPDLLAVLLVEVLVAAPDAVPLERATELEAVVAPAAPVEAAPVEAAPEEAAPEEAAPPVAEPEPDPLSLTAVLTQLVSEPAMIEAEAENAWAPVLSLRAALKLVPTGRSTFQVKVVPVCWGNILMGFWPVPGMSVKK